MKNTALPNEEDEFMRTFYNESENKIKNPELFKARIMGLVSFYRTSDKSLLPEVLKNEVVKVPASDYQFLNYAKVRKEEIEQDQNKKKTTPKKKKKKPQ